MDTRNKRFSAISLGLEYGRVRPDPDGSIGAPDRAHFMPLYAGIPLGGTPVVAVGNDWLRLRRR